MSNIRLAVSAAIMAFGLLTGAALSAESSLQIVIGGEAYDGPPRFEVSFDGKAVGQGTVAAAIDTATVGRFADAADRSDYVEAFSFPIPEAIFTPKGEVRIRFLNEAYGGDGSNRDRNLYLASVAVNGRAVTLSGLAVQATTASARTETLGEFLVLRDGNEEGVGRPPQGGWPLPGTALAATVPASPQEQAESSATPVAVPKIAPAPTEAKDASVGAQTGMEATDSDTQASTELAALQESPARAGAAGEVDDGAPEEDATVTASISKTPASDAACNETTYNVMGFNENSNDLTQRLKDRLDQVVADIGDRKCRIEVVGYSSSQGAFATNALFAIERAQNVLAYLRQSGLRFERAVATGGGATERFGASLAANRRVVITVGP